MNIDVEKTVENTISHFRWGGTSWSYKPEIGFEKALENGYKQIVSYKPYFAQTVKISDKKLTFCLTRGAKDFKGAGFDVYELQVLGHDKALLYSKKQIKNKETEKGNLENILPLLQSIKGIKLIEKPSLAHLMFKSSINTK